MATHDNPECHECAHGLVAEDGVVCRRCVCVDVDSQKPCVSGNHAECLAKCYIGESVPPNSQETQCTTCPSSDMYVSYSNHEVCSFECPANEYRPSGERSRI